MSLYTKASVETDGFSMDYLRFGSGEKTLVIIPGLSVQSVMGSAEALVQAYGMFSEKYTIYLFDRRTDIPDVYTVNDMARDTSAAFRRLGIHDAFVFGASQGGMIAMEIAADHPELVKKLILGSTSASVSSEGTGALKNWIALAEAGDAEALYLAFGENIYPREIFETSRELFIAAAKTVTATELERFVIMARSMNGLDLTRKLAAISCPVLIIGDTDDRVLSPAASSAIYDLLKSHTHAELYMYEGYGHAVYDTAPDYRERMMAFMEA